MQNNMVRKERDSAQALSKSMAGMGNNPLKEGKSSGESPTNDDRFIKMVEATGNAYSEALRKLAEGEGTL